jgi:hypothetical protein
MVSHRAGIEIDYEDENEDEDERKGGCKRLPRSNSRRIFWSCLIGANVQR